MNLGSASQTSTKAIAAVGKSPAMPAKSAPGFVKAYEAMYPEKEQQDQEKSQQKAIHNTDHQETVPKTALAVPEIFKLLKRYRFKDFFKLSMNGDDSTLDQIIKKSRKSRDVCNALPVSRTYRTSNDFINQMGNLYSNVNWLMQAKPGNLYNNVL